MVTTHINAAGRAQCSQGHLRRVSTLLVSICLLLGLGVAHAQTTETFTISIDDYISEDIPGPGAGRLDVVGDVDVYEFAGTAGNAVYVEPNFYDGTGIFVRWQVTSPSGVVLFDDTLRTLQGIVPGRFELTESGTYRITVGGGGTTFAGVYQFRLWQVQPTTDLSNQFELDIPVVGVHLTPGAILTYDFSGNAGQVLHFNVAFLGGDTNYRTTVRWSLTSPAGAVLFDQPMFDLTDAPTPRDADGFLLENGYSPGFVTLPETGTYRITTRNDLPFTGNNVFLVSTVPPPQVFNINIGDSIAIDVPGPGAGVLERAGAQDIYQFTGNMGQTIYTGVLYAEPFLTSDAVLVGFFAQTAPPRWQLVTPSGTVVFDNALPRDIGANDPLVLPETGTYQVIVTLRDFVPFQYSLRIAPDPTSGLLQFRDYNIPPGQNVLTVGTADGLLSAPNPGTGTVTLLTPPADGTLMLNPDGSFVYTAGSTFVRQDTFTYRYTDLGGNTVDGLVYIQANSVLVPDFYNGNREQTLVVPAPGVLANDNGATEAALDFYNGPGTLDLRPDGSFTYTPAPLFTGIDVFGYFDPNSPLRQTTIVTINIGNLVVRVPPPQFTPQDTPLSVPGVSAETTEPDIRVNLSVPNGNLAVTNDAAALAQGGIIAANTAVTVTGNGTGDVTLDGPRTQVNLVLQTLVYTPNAGFVGVDEVTVVANAGGLSATGRFTITVGEDGIQIVIEGDGGEDTLETVTLDVQAPDDGSVVFGNVPACAVPNGDVFFRVIVNSGDFRVPTAEIGDEEVLAIGVQNASEVFGLTFGGVPVPRFGCRIEVCILGTGRFFYRDATGMPRTTVELATRPEGAYTCAEVPNSGTVILTGGEPSPAATQTAQQVSSGSVVPLENCMVTLTNILNLREGPSVNSPVIRRMPYNITLTAIERQGDWFYVDYLGTFGWAFGDFLLEEGDCG